MDVIRTPDARFEHLPDYPFAPHYAHVPTCNNGREAEIRVHYLDEGPSDAAPVLLMHGEPSWSDLYRHMIRPLVGAGHRVIACTLRGLGTRQDELHPGITLSDHIDDVCQQVEEAGFDRFILAGHSYGGMVISGMASRLGARIDAICYIDAFLPSDGESLWDITGEFEHNWYIDTQKTKPGYVDPIGAVQQEQ